MSNVAILSPSPLPKGLRAEGFRDVGGLLVGVVDVTPAMAAQWIETHNEGNRRIIKTKVETYARIMGNGGWVLNGEPIIFDDEWTMKSGQHRCLSSVRAHVGFRSLVVVGVGPDAFGTIDTGASRSGGTYMDIAGQKNAHALAAMTSLVYRYEHSLALSVPVHSTEQEEVLGRHPELVDYSRLVSRFPIRNVARSTYAGLAYLFSRADAALERDMTLRFFEGLGLSKGDPVHTLRERALANQAATGKLTARHWYVFIVKTWNALYAGNEMRILRWTGAEDVPRIAGLVPARGTPLGPRNP